jgi:hypothetical protein
MPMIPLKTQSLYLSERFLYLAICLTILMLFLSWGNSQAQCVTYSIGVKGDTLNCVDTAHHKQGPWVVHVDPLRGEPGYEEEGLYKEDVKNGIWRRYDLQGDLLAVENYKFGSKDSLQEYFMPSGDRLREESWMAVDPRNPYDTVTVFDDPHNPFRSEKKVIKLDASCVKHGTWQYFDPSTGTVAKTERYVLGKLQNGLTDDVPQKPSATEANKPKEVQDYEKSNSNKKKIKVRTGETGG